MKYLLIIALVCMVITGIDLLWPVTYLSQNVFKIILFSGLIVAVIAVIYAFFTKQTVGNKWFAIVLTVLYISIFLGLMYSSMNGAEKNRKLFEKTLK